MSGEPEIGLLAVGCCTPLGDDPWRAIRAGERAVSPQPHLEMLADPRAAVVRGPDLGPFLKRKKDVKMLPRAAMLALPAAAGAMAGLDSREGKADRAELGLVVAVGREPPDCDEAEAALVAMAEIGGSGAGVLSLERLAGAGRALYPPLLPLKTLPNMILAHVSIAHGICGENATFAGGEEAGRQAIAEAIRLARRLQGPVLVGAAHAGADLASARDRLRLGRAAPTGEAAIFVLIGPGGRPIERDRLEGARYEGIVAEWRAACGACGPVDGLAALISTPIMP